MTLVLLRLGRGDFVSLMGKTRPLVKSLGVPTDDQYKDTGYGRYVLLVLLQAAAIFFHLVLLYVFHL